jgi:hypothetical protein
LFYEAREHFNYLRNIQPTLKLLIMIVLLTACVENSTNENTSITPTSETESDLSEPVQVIGQCSVEGDFPDTTTCVTVSVTCESLPSATAELRITLNSPGTTLLGTIVLGSGGTGNSFISGPAPLPNLPALSIIKNLANAGYKVIERRWLEGWFGQGSEGLGIIGPSCRHAELLRWLDTQETESGPICAFGNSGGGAEIAYGLTRWNTEEILDAAIIGSGPPMARLDIGCLGFDYNPGWQQTCTVLWNNTQTQCGDQPPICTLYERKGAFGPMELDAALSVVDQENVCTNSNADFATLLSENSVLYPGADVEYPETAVHFLFGRSDCTESSILGTLYLDAIISEKSVTYLDDVPHEIQNTEIGANAIVSSIIQSCTIDP